MAVSVHRSWSITCLLFLCLFTVGTIFFYFYYSAYPMFPASGDDWRYVAAGNNIFPSKGRWNPARILQEVTMPASGYFSAYVIMPVTGLGYLQAFTLTFALTAAALYTVLVWGCYRLCTALSGSRLVGVVCAFWLISGLFASYKTGVPALYTEFSPNIFHSYYLPSLFNAFIVFWLIFFHYGSVVGGSSPFVAPLSRAIVLKHRSVLVLGLVFLYFAQFSMTTSSAISAFFAGCLLAWRYGSAALSTRSVFGFFRSLSVYDVVLILVPSFWLIAALYDIGGRRYVWSLGPKDISFTAQAGLTLAALQQTISPVIFSLAAALSSVAAVVAGASYWFMPRVNRIHARYNVFILQVLVSLGISFVVLVILFVLITVRTQVEFSKDFSFGLFFYAMVAIVVSAAYLAKRALVFMFLMPFLALFLFGYSFKSTTYTTRPHVAWHQHGPVMQGWIDQVQHAHQAGHIFVFLQTHTPREHFYADVFAEALFKHGIVSRRLWVVFVLVENEK